MKLPILAYGDKGIPIALTLENVEINDSEDFSSDAVIETCYYEKIKAKSVSISDLLCKALVKRWSDDGEIVFDNISCEIAKENYICEADDLFICRPI